MNTQHLQGLLDRVKDGDQAAAERLQRLLQPVVFRAVRRVLQTQDYGTPVGRHVRCFLNEAGAAYVPDGPAVLAQITQAICGQTLADLRTQGRSELTALETVLA
jgi:hypothetical protein